MANASDIDAVFDEVEPAKGGGGLLPAGEYIGEVVSIEIRESRKSWVDQEVSIKLAVTEGDHQGKVTFCDFEYKPLEDREGNPSKGKIKYFKWQVESLGYTGKHSEFQSRFMETLGAKVRFEQKVEDYMGENGPQTGANGREPRINPESGLPYIDREVTLKENLLPGHGAAAAAPAPTGQTQVY